MSTSLPGAELLRRRLTDRGISQRGLEQRLGIASGLVNKWLSGERKPGRDLALALSRVLQIPVSAWTDAGARTGTDG
jgi:transcriptional regulator with XRE-family HTH domain